MLFDAILVSVSVLAAYFDCRLRKIPNWLILSGLVCGIAFSAYHGLQPLLFSVLGFVAGIGVLLIPFAMGWIGAGDVKYLGVVGALLGVAWLPRVFFYSALAAGLIAVFYIASGAVRELRFREFVGEIKLAALSLGAVRPGPLPSRGRGGSVPWGVAFAAGTIIAYYFDPTGSLAGF